MEYSLFTRYDQLTDLTDTEEDRKKRRVKREIPVEEVELPPPNFNFDDVSGVIRVGLTDETQKMFNCVVGHSVTEEHRWKYITKGLIYEHLEEFNKSSEFLPFADQINDYTDAEMLLIYIPGVSDERDEFYLCVTQAATEEIAKALQEIQARQEEKLQKCVERKARPWKSRGSEKEVALMSDKSNRSLLIVDVESKYPVKPKPVKFRFRLAQDTRDGYVHLLCSRTAFNNVVKKRIDACAQVKPSLKSNGAQTICKYPKNAYTQYQYGGDSIKLDVNGEKQLMRYIQERVDSLCDTIRVNAFINFYHNDYKILVKDSKYTCVPEVQSIKEYISFVDTSLPAGSTISGVSWHPMWTGVIAIAYSNESLKRYRTCQMLDDEVLTATYGVRAVLIWSFDDSLFPKLYLETPRDISVLSFCPYNQNLMIGGCVNGQIIIWDIENKLERIENQEILTERQKRYKKDLQALIPSLNVMQNLQRIRPAAVSSLEFSHRSTVSAIKWLSPFREITKTGQVKEIDESENRTSLSFMTASRDGTILIWNLSLKSVGGISIKRPRQLKRLKQRPLGLTVDSSVYSVFHRNLVPLFKISINEPGTVRPLPICSISIRHTKAKYVKRNIDTNKVFKLTDRVIYKPIFNRAEHPITTTVLIGSSEGDFLTAKWEGFDTNSGEKVNKETAKLHSFSKFHDGPVVCVQRTELFPDLTLTVGGKVFAIWKQSLPDKPVFWKKSKVRYTHGAWNNHRPSIFELARSDGCIEFWHLKTRSDRYQDIRVVSSTGISGTFMHPRPLNQNIMAIAEDTGGMRLFYVSHNLSDVTEEDSTSKLCDREVIRKKMLAQWQENWNNKNADLLRAKYEETLRQQQLQEEVMKKEKAKLQQEKERLEKEAAVLSIPSRPEPGHYREWAQAQLLAKEKERMNKILLEKKSLDLDVLVKQQQPLLKLMEEQKRKKKKQEDRLKNAKAIFEEAVGVEFPLVLDKKEDRPSDPYEATDSPEVTQIILEEYKALEVISDKFVERNAHKDLFSFSRMLIEGGERRKLLDGFYSRYNHKQRFQKEKEAREKARKVSESSSQSAAESAESY